MENKTKKENKMREIEIEKIVLSCSYVGDELEKACKLLERLSGMKAYKTKAKKRIPTFGIRPGLEIGCKVTVRKDKEKLLKRLLASVNNQIRMKKIQDNHFSFGIDEYIEIPGIEYQRDIGILGLDVTVVFARKGKRVKIRKIKKGKLPRKQNVSKEEIKEFLIKKFDVEVI